jgi:hypothetical protein
MGGDRDSKVQRSKDREGQRSKGKEVVLTLGISAAGVTVRLDPMAMHRSAFSPCSKLDSKVSISLYNSN